MATETLEARGSWRAKARKKKEREEESSSANPIKRRPPFKRLSRGELLNLIREVPGYDPGPESATLKFDADKANDALSFFVKELCHVEGAMAGKPFRLERWQQAVMANLFGWQKKTPAGWVRRYREVFVYVPRKNGKTPWMAGLALYVLLHDNEAGQQNYIAASSRDQAGKLFRHAKGMVQQNPRLMDGCRIYGGTAQAGQSKSIVKLPEETSFLQIIAAEGGGQHGGNSHLVIVDELHEQPDRELVDVLTTSMASANRKQPLIVYITTADFNRPSICNEKHDYAGKVRDGIIDDPSFLPVVYEAKEGEDWTDPAVWARANPNLGISVSEEYLCREVAKAKENPAYENTVRRLHLNQRTEQDVRAIDMARWDACGALLCEPADLEGKECYAGLDLSSTTDLSAFAMLFPQDGTYSLLLRFWAPRERARQRSKRDRVPYEAWAEQGFLTLTDGDVIDYDRIRADVNALGQRYRIKEIAADRWNATQIITQLQSDGFNVVAFGQGYTSMTAPTKELLALVAATRLAHGGNPILRWMASLFAIEKDAADNQKPSKKKSTDRIDGIVAAIMALGRAMVSPGESSVYDTHGIEVL